MLQVGIVGLKNHEQYTEVKNQIDDCCLSGIYDPSFKMQVANNPLHETDFNSLINKSDVLIFCKPNNFFYTLVIEALYHSKHIILDSTHNFTYEQINTLSKIAKEANANIFTIHKYWSHELLEYYQKTQNKPLFIESNVELAHNENLLKTINEEISICLLINQNNVRKVKTNVFSANSQVPDLYYVALEFDNGCFCNISVSSFCNTSDKQMRIIGFNTLHKLNFNENKCTAIIENKNFNKNFDKTNNTAIKMLKRQMEHICKQIKSNKTSYYPLQTELRTSKIIKQITDKLRICNNLL